LPSPHDTADPRLKNTLSSKELADCFIPTAEELDLARQVAKGTGPRICFLLLKRFQKHAMTQALHDLSQAGESIEAETLRRLSPYLTTEHINRFGDYLVDIERKLPAVNYHFDILPFKLTAPKRF
jgi:hypothetical protein